MLRNVLWWPATTSSRVTNYVARKGFVGAQGPRLAVARTDSARSMCTQLQGAALARLWKAAVKSDRRYFALLTSVHFL